jgi:hypothetical protein
MELYEKAKPTNMHATMYIFYEQLSMHEPVGVPGVLER